jgi:Zn finger protein HypA/HybF involved in hydrogenase expression
MTCMWTVGSEIISSDQSYLSGSMLVDDSESFEIPWFDIGIGLVVAIVIAIISRLVYTWKQEGDVDSSAGKLKVTRHAKGHSSGTSASLDEGKLSVKNREVECSACSQRLSVPETFGGTARCPACKHQFPVTALIEAPAPKTTPDPSPASQADSADSKELPNSKGRGPVATNSDEGDNDAVVSSTEDILSCPSCDSKLRVPLEKRPARARCPACKKEFMAIIG